MESFNNHPIDPEKVRTVVYHLPDGESYAVPVEGFESHLELGPGDVCDTSEIDGTIHYFPRGHA